MSVPRWWPFIMKSRAQAAIAEEYHRATVDGSAKVHRWAVDANFNVYNHAVPQAAARAAFQEAERMFRPDPITL